VDLGELPGDIPSLFRDLLQGLGTMQRLEEKISRFEHPIPWASGGVPEGVWMGMAAVAFFLFAGWGFIVAFFGTPLFLGMLAFLGLGLAWKHEQWRRKTLEETKAARQKAGEEQRIRLQQICGQAFVLKAPAAWVVHLPQRLSLQQKLRTLPKEQATILSQALLNIDARLGEASLGGELHLEELLAFFPS